MKHQETLGAACLVAAEQRKALSIGEICRKLCAAIENGECMVSYDKTYVPVAYAVWNQQHRYTTVSDMYATNGDYVTLIHDLRQRLTKSSKTKGEGSLVTYLQPSSSNVRQRLW